MEHWTKVREDGQNILIQHKGTNSQKWVSKKEFAAAARASDDSALASADPVIKTDQTATTVTPMSEVVVTPDMAEKIEAERVAAEKAARDAAEKASASASDKK